MNQPIRITEALVNYALNSSYETLNQNAINVEKHSLNDSIACLLAASGLDEPGQAIAAYAENIPGGCTLFASDKKVTAIMAALANGSLAHAMDYDDSHEKSITHPNAVCTSAVMALAEHMGNVNGKEFLHALVLGSDISCRIGQGLNEDILKYGWNSPSMCETIGATIACGRLYGLDHDQMFDAIALAMTQFVCSGESTKSKSSSIRTIREGFGAQAAVQSVLLAKYNTNARFETPLEGESGWYYMYARGNYNPEAIIENLGTYYETESICYKPWPCCRATHTTVEAMLELVKEHDLKPDDILGVHVSMYENGVMVMEPREAKTRPGSPAIAKFSLPFLVGTVAKYRSVALDSYTPQRLSDPDIFAVADRVTYEINPELGRDRTMYTDISVKTTKGEFFVHKDNAMGDAGCPMTEEQIREKFFSCCRLAKKKFDDEHIQKLYDMIDHVEELDNVSQLMAML